MKQPSPDPEALAIEVLEFLAADPERLWRFLDVSGLRPDTLRTAARQPEFCPAVLGYVLGDETVLVAFAQSKQRDPAAVARAAEAGTAPTEHARPAQGVAQARAVPRLNSLNSPDRTKSP